MNKRPKRNDDTFFFVHAPNNWTSKLLALLEASAHEHTWIREADLLRDRPGVDPAEYKITIHVTKTGGHRDR